MSQPVIESVRAIVLTAELQEPWQFSVEAYDRSTCVVVEVSSSSGEVGYGEAITRRSPRTTATLIEDLLDPIAVGRPTSDIGGIWADAVGTLRPWGHERGFLMEGVSGLDVALWDLRARELGISVSELLPGPTRRSVPTYASSVYFQPTVDAAVNLATHVMDAGHRRLKIKIGYDPGAGGLERDVEVVRAIHAAVPPGTPLMLDANSAYSLAEARILVEQLRSLSLHWLEEPLPPDDRTGYADLAAWSPIPLAAGESEFSVFGFRDLLTSRSIAYAQPDIARCGGFTGLLQIASLCYAFNVAVCPHTGFSGGLNNLASLHVAASVQGTPTLEHMIIGNPLREIFTAPLPEPVDGEIRVPDEPGLGHRLDPEKLRGFSEPG